MTTRVASHAGSWYSKAESVLTEELNEWTNAVGTNLAGDGIPLSGARVIIAPYADSLRYAGILKDLR